MLAPLEQPSGFAVANADDELPGDRDVEQRHFPPLPTVVDNSDMNKDEIVVESPEDYAEMPPTEDADIEYSNQPQEPPNEAKRARGDGSSEQATLYAQLSTFIDQNTGVAVDDLEADFISDAQVRYLSQIDLVAAQLGFEVIPLPPFFCHKPLGGFRLAIDHQMEKFIDMVRMYRIVTLDGFTSCGKSTRVPVALFRLFWELAKHDDPKTTPRPKIVLSVQPKESLCKKIRHHVKVDLKSGENIGYATELGHSYALGVVDVMYVTYETFLIMWSQDITLSQYCVVFLDEVHEATIPIETALAVVNKVANGDYGRIDPYLRFVISSATADMSDILKFFGEKHRCKAHSVYDPADKENTTREYELKHEFLKVPVDPRYVQTMAIIAYQYHRNSDAENDHIMAFLPGEQECDDFCDQLNTLLLTQGWNEKIAHLVLKYHGKASDWYKTTVQEPCRHDERKIIASTNYGESGITIPGIGFVIDSGRVRHNVYCNETLCNVLFTNWVSQAEAFQRAGRAGRTRPGRCLHLYTADHFLNAMRDRLPTEIERVSLEKLVTGLMRVCNSPNQIMSFGLPHQPSDTKLAAAYNKLYYLGVVSERSVATRKGLVVSQFHAIPIELAELIFECQHLCVPSFQFTMLLDITDIVAMMCSKPWLKGFIGTHPDYHNKYGDPICALKAMRGYVRAPNKLRYCHQHYLVESEMQHACQLAGVLRAKAAELRFTPGVVRANEDEVVSFLYQKMNHQRGIRVKGCNNKYVIRDVDPAATHVSCVIDKKSSMRTRTTSSTSAQVKYPDEIYFINKSALHNNDIKVSLRYVFVVPKSLQLHPSVSSNQKG